MIGKFRKVTPEEKLLHIIEKPEEIDKLGINMKNKKDKLSRLKLRASSASFKKIDFKKITLRGVNKVMLWICVIVTLVFITYFIKEEKYIHLRFDNLKKASIKKESLDISQTKRDMSDISTYLKETEEKNPFHVLPVIEKVEIKKTEQKEVDLELVGIIWSDKPQAIIEDNTSKKNYLVYEGDTIDKFKIDEITPSEVKLTFHFHQWWPNAGGAVIS